MWPNGYQETLQSWVQLRSDCQNKPLLDQLNQITGWWGHAPRVKHAVHWNDQKNWPTPWELLADNNYDELALALGIAYTIIMLSDITTTVELVQAKDDTASEYYIILVDNGKYILNYDPWLTVNSEQTNFTILNKVDSDQLLKKIG